MMQLGKKELLDVFARLDEELDGCPHSEILVAGGAAIAFWWNDKRTWDVDVVVDGFPHYLSDAIEIVAERQALHLRWMNNAATGIRLPALELNRMRVFNGENISIFLPDMQYVLAMKLYAHRDKDFEDAVFLARETKKTTAEELEVLFGKAYSLELLNDDINDFIEAIEEAVAV